MSGSSEKIGKSLSTKETNSVKSAVSVVSVVSTEDNWETVSDISSVDEVFILVAILDSNVLISLHKDSWEV